MLNNLEKIHSEFSASGSETWLNCVGAIQAQREVKTKQKPSTYADEGTLAHELADRCLKDNLSPHSFVDFTLNQLNISLPTYKEDFKITIEMADYIAQYIDYVLSYKTENSILLTEKKVDYSNLAPDGFGTCDASIITGDKCHVFDLKYGKGIEVSAVNNTQGMFYALGIYNEFKSYGIKSFEIHIAQPRLDNFSKWEISTEELLKFAEYVKERVKLALKPNAIRTPGYKQCRWCKAKGFCDVAYREVERTMDIVAEDMDETFNIDNLTFERKELIVKNKKFILDIIKAVEDSLFKDILEGKKSNSFKLVVSSKNRQLKDGAENTIVEKLGEQAYNKKLIGLGELEKKLSKKVVDELTYRPEGELILVDIKDKRPEVINIDNFSKDYAIDNFNDFDDI